MAARRQESALRKIRDAIVDQQYVVTPHAMLEMREDRLDIVDVESAILTGSIERVFTHDPRGPRYEIVGQACDLSTKVGVIVRYAGTWIIITVYAIEG